MSSFDWGSSGSSGNDATTSEKGSIKLAGNLSGTADLPEVIDLTITGEQNGSILYNNGTDWVQLSPGTNGQFLKTLGSGSAPSWSNLINSGIATINFGNAPGSNYSSIVVSGQTNIQSTSKIKLSIQSNSTSSHNEFEHQMLGLFTSFVAGNIVVGNSFEIYGLSSLRLTGEFKINWEWS